MKRSKEIEWEVFMTFPYEVRRTFLNNRVDSRCGSQIRDWLNLNAVGSWVESDAVDAIYFENEQDMTLALLHFYGSPPDNSEESIWA